MTDETIFRLLLAVVDSVRAGRDAVREASRTIQPKAFQSLSDSELDLMGLHYASEVSRSAFRTAQWSRAARRCQNSASERCGDRPAEIAIASRCRTARPFADP